MIEHISAREFMLKIKTRPVIDVRSPKEFNQGHIAGAFNIPLFDDEERAQVGVIYKHSGRDASVLKGLEIAGPKMAGFVKRLNNITGQKDILIHCWRGGMRSENMAWLFDQAGFHVDLLAGGYKAYRRYIRAAFSEPAKIIVLGGLTGSGKTRMLETLSGMGEQVLNLEKLARHKGSVFGTLGQPPQPTNEQFENDTYASWMEFDLSKPVWLEDESRMIGTVNVPDPLFEQMGKAVMIKISIPREERIKILVGEYSIVKKPELKKAIGKIAEQLGGAKTKLAWEALDRDDFDAAASLVLSYYDKAYEHSIARRTGERIYSIDLATGDPVINARSVLENSKSLLFK